MSVSSKEIVFYLLIILLLCGSPSIVGASLMHPSYFSAFICGLLLIACLCNFSGKIRVRNKYFICLIFVQSGMFLVSATLNSDIQLLFYCFQYFLFSVLIFYIFLKYSAESLILVLVNIWSIFVVILILFYILYFSGMVDWTREIVVFDRVFLSFHGIINSPDAFWSDGRVLARAVPLFDEPGQASLFSIFLVSAGHYFLDIKKHGNKLRLIMYGLCATGSFVHILISFVYFIFYDIRIKNFLVAFLSFFLMLALLSYFAYYSWFSGFLERVFFHRVFGREAFERGWVLSDLSSSSSFLAHKLRYLDRVYDGLQQSFWFGQGINGWNSVAMNAFDIWTKFGFFTFCIQIFVLALVFRRLRYVEGGISLIFCLSISLFQRPSVFISYVIVFSTAIILCQRDGHVFGLQSK